MVSSNTTVNVVDAIGLTKVFRDFWMRTKARAVDNVTLSIEPHEIFGLLGPNGSGKSTIIKMILGLLHKTSGRLQVFGCQPSDVEIKKRIGFLPEESYMYRFLNPVETLDYYGKLFALDRRTRKRRTHELLEMVGLSQSAHRPIGEFSKGMTRRIGLAQALINDPDFLILDEPTSGLDPIGTRQVKDLILDLGRRGKTILLSSHLLADVEDVCDRMVVLYGGKIRAQGTAAELLTDTESTIIHTARLSDETVSRIDGVLRESAGQSIEKIEHPRQRLEQFFMEIVERARQEQTDTSGAVHGGETASFLRGDESQGDDLIDTLVSDQPEQVKSRAIKPHTTESITTNDDGQVLAELLHEEPKPPVRTDVKQPSKAPSPAPNVDQSVIDSLVDEDSPQTDDEGSPDSSRS